MTPRIAEKSVDDVKSTVAWIDTSTVCPSYIDPIDNTSGIAQPMQTYRKLRKQSPHHKPLAMLLVINPSIAISQKVT